MALLDQCDTQAEKKMVYSSIGSCPTAALKRQVLEWTVSSVKLQDFFYPLNRYVCSELTALCLIADQCSWYSNLASLRNARTPLLGTKTGFPSGRSSFSNRLVLVRGFLIFALRRKFAYACGWVMTRVCVYFFVFYCRKSAVYPDPTCENIIFSSGTVAGLCLPHPFDSKSTVIAVSRGCAPGL